ncbi:protein DETOXIFICATION 29-like isoform X1 [Rhododendron vialii]|uniref:protein DETOXIFICATION 29-like isoform X1 n=1 Tax=Rhododendron vialii TaxID=182163 RepID=UPI00265FB7E5|nr:protein DETOXIFICATION 29-like isoform X1 [Rhododendron vialii]
MEDGEHPLLSSIQDEYHNQPHDSQIHDIASYDEQDHVRSNKPIPYFLREFYVESKKLWYLAAPAILTAVCQYSLGAITQVFAGQLGTTELATFSVENSIIAGYGFGIMLGMGSALETLCGIAFGAGKIEMLGIYMQRSWLVLNSTALILTLPYIFATPFLKIMGQTDKISKEAGTFALWMIPQLFAYAMNYPLTKFLQAQSKFMAMAVISAVALVLHSIFSWLLMLKLGWGMVGAAVVLNSSWWFIVLAELVYIFCGACGQAWNGFSWMAFQNLWGFLKLSVASAFMIALETWYIMVLVLFAGYLKNAEVSVDASGICANIMGWTINMAGFGLSAAISVRVSNELGASHPKAARFSALVVAVTSILIGLFLGIILSVTAKQYTFWFSTDAQVQEIVYELNPLLGISIFLCNVQLPLAGVAIGAGWQAYVAYVNLGCYYLVGIPLCLLMAFKFNMGIQGIWWGVLAGLFLQICVITWMICRTNWNNEAYVVGDKLKQWGGETDDSQSYVETVP